MGDLKGHVEITIKLWMKSPIKITPASTTFIATLCLPTGSALFLLPPPTPTTLFLGSADLIFEIFNIEVSGSAIRLDFWFRLGPLGKQNLL